MNRLITIVALFASFAIAGSAFAQTDPYSYQRQGVFGCSLNGAYSMSVGTMSATGGAYVPVNDAAVTLNTGFLVYKECVLRGVVNRMRESGTAQVAGNALINYQTGRNGRPLYSVDLVAEKDEVRSQAVLDALQNGQLDSLHPSLRDSVVRAVAQNYMKARSGADLFTCDYSGNLQMLYEGKPDGSIWSAITAIGDPDCIPLYAYNSANDYVLSGAESCVQDMLMRLQWGEGTYGIETRGPNCRTIVNTPASIVRDNITDLLQTGFRQLENANDIDQMVGALFSGMSAQVVNDARGLAGLTQSVGGQPSYLDRVAQQSRASLQQTAANAALQILSAARQVETAFNQIMNAIAEILTRAANTLKAREDQCLVLITEKICTGTRNGSTCTDSGGARYTIASTTAPDFYAQTAIDEQIAPLASSTIENIRTSDSALQRINVLIQSLQSGASIDAQRLALQQLDEMVASRQLHSQYDLQAAQQRQQDVTSAMADFVQRTTEAWADSEDASIGWCNVNNSAVVDMWKNRWRQQ